MYSIVETVSAPAIAFRDRHGAGRRLVEALGLTPDPGAAAFAVPRGGVLVAEPIARALAVPLDLALVRKLPIPHSPEAGFGAVALDGSVIFNERLMGEISFSSGQVDGIVAKVLAEVRRRAEQYLGKARPAAVGGKTVTLVDDGLASGYTVIAAAKMLRRQGPARLRLCVPVSPLDSLRLVEPYFDEVFCLIGQSRLPFAVASFYEDFSDPTDDEVREILKRIGLPA